MTATALALDLQAHAPPPPTLRDYQDLAVRCVERRYSGGVPRLYVEMPTGTGKTVVLAELARREIAKGGRVLAVAHRRELIDQISWAMRVACGAERVGVVMGAQDEFDRPVTVATIQSLRLSRLRRITDRGGLTLVEIDEVHHVTPQNAYGRLLDNIPDARVCGVSATPFRADGDGMRDVVPVCAFSRSIKQMQRAGYLCELEWHRVNLEGLDLSHVKVRKQAEGRDYDQTELGERMSADDLVDEVVDATAQLVVDRRAVVVFAVSVAHAKALADAYQAAGISARAAWGDMDLDDRVELLRAWRAGEVQVVTNCALFCLDDQTEILTDAGWVGIDEMLPSHRVANWEPGGRVFFKEPEAIVRRPREPGEGMYVLETARRSIRVSSRHRMLYRTTADGPFLKAPVDDLAGRAVGLPICGMADPLDVGPEQAVTPSPDRTKRLVTATASRIEAERRVTRRYGLRRADPRELSLAECGLIGFWLGDGSRNDLRRGGVEYTLNQSYVYPRIVEWVDRTIAEAGFQAVRREGTGRTPAGNRCSFVTWSLPRGTGGGSQQRTGVYRIEPYLDKAGSPLLWGLDADQFEAFLSGYWYADGNHRDGASPPNGHGLHIRSARRTVVDLLQAIGVVRGWSVSVSDGRQPAVAHYAPQWTMVFHRRDTHQMGGTDPSYRIQREPAPWRQERLWCVKTETRNIITRRRGTVTVMGNTEGFDYPGIDAVVICRPTKIPGLYLQMAGRGTRIAPGKENCLVVDVAGNIRDLRDDQVLLPHVWGSMPVDAEDDGGAGGRRLSGLGEAQEVVDGGSKTRPLFAVSPIQASGIAWAEDPASGAWGCNRGTGEHLLILPDPDGSGLWRCASARASSDGMVEILRIRKSTGTLYDQVRFLLPSILDDPNASYYGGRDLEWRTQRPTRGQLGRLRAMNRESHDAAVAGGWNRGDVSVAIEAAFVAMIVAALPEGQRPPAI